MLSEESLVLLALRVREDALAAIRRNRADHSAHRRLDAAYALLTALAPTFRNNNNSQGMTAPGR